MTEPRPEGPQDVGLYVHWPYCARICPYCDFNVVRDRGERDAPAAQVRASLARAIVADLEAQGARLGRRRLASVFFGGGTPSLMDPDWAGDVLAAATRLFDPKPDLEVTLEANPTDAEADRFAAFAAAGVNRLSLGLQSLDDAALTFLGRNHDAAEARRAAEVAAAVFPRLSIDMIYARPGQTPDAWRAELRAALALGPEHVSPYQLTIEAGTAFDRAVQRGRWAPPEPDVAAALYETTGEVLEAAGLPAYEVSNHARGPAARSRHNLIYWRGGDYLGVGPGAHGRVTEAGARWATLTPAPIAGYLRKLETAGCGLSERTRLSPREAALERLLMGLRTVEGVALAELAPLAIDPAAIETLVSGGLLSHDRGRLIATRSGRAVLDRITLDLAASADAG
ncbi:MAG TPA: radical SAM family heme chaperone HemW [Caulobacteraceae bacterium]|nr:radical SAM family heme chaperone HemW [Caulobacteraceae bacterium]